jgi:Fe-S-cluster-containing hydrogenase component 2
MEIRVDEEKCIGCDACIEVCPTGAVHLNGDLVVLDQAICSMCQVCVDTCPTGAMMVVKLPLLAPEPAGIEPVSKSQIMIPQPVPLGQKPWVNALLSFAGREILPRMVDALIATLDRRLAPAPSTKAQICSSYPNTGFVPPQNSGLGKRRRKRYGQGGRRQDFGADEK